MTGEWAEADYYQFSEPGGVVELSDGHVEVSDPPTFFHQLILLRLSVALHAFVMANHLGQVCFAPLPVRLWSGTIREPDLMFMSAAHASRMGQYWGVPDLAVEILSPGTARKDREIKRKEYARAGVAEYWIVDPEARTVEVMRGSGGGEDYEITECFRETEMLTSEIFGKFALPLSELFAPA